jgi:[acyl-carrier-protein] S-malonyltransferase
VARRAGVRSSPWTGTSIKRHKMIEKQKIAFIFPGAAVEPCGAEGAFYQKHHEIMAPFIQTASEAAGMDLQKFIMENRLGALDERSSQLFTFSFSHGVAMAHRQSGIVPMALAGYSLGIYAAVSVSGALAFGECCGIVGLAFDIMKKHCKGEEFAMGAIVGLSHAETQRLCASGKYPSVCHTNTNSETCGVFSGKKDEIGKYFEDARAQGALSAVLFNVTIPYHHPQYLSDAAREFSGNIKGLSWRDAGIPIISSIDQKPLVKSVEIVDFVAMSLASPVHWHHVVQTLAATGAATLYECGPGISLAQNGRFIQNGLRYITIKKALKRTGA